MLFFGDDILKNPSASGGNAPRPLPGALPLDPTGNLLRPPDPRIIFLLFHFSPVPCLLQRRHSWCALCITYAGNEFISHVQILNLLKCRSVRLSPMLWMFWLVVLPCWWVPCQRNHRCYQRTARWSVIVPPIVKNRTNIAGHRHQHLWRTGRPCCCCLRMLLFALS